MLRIQSPNDEQYLQQSFQNEHLVSQSERGSVGENSYYITTPSKTSKKPNLKTGASKTTITLNQSTGNQSNTSILKQVMRKDQEIEEIRSMNSKLQEKVKDLEYLLNKAAEEVRRRNEDQQHLEVQLNRVTMELHQQTALVNQLQYEQQSDPNLQQMWERGAYLENENEQLRHQLAALEQDFIQKVDVMAQSYQQLEGEMQRLREDSKAKTKSIKKLKSKNKALKGDSKSQGEVDRVVAALKQEIENQREDIKELLKEKIEQERIIKKHQPVKQDHQEMQLLKLQTLSQQQQLQTEQESQKTLQQRLEQTQLELDAREQQVTLLEQELERHQQLLSDTELHYQSQVRDLEQQIKRAEHFQVQMAGSQSLKHDLTYSRSQSSQQQPARGVPNLNFRGSIEEAELFLNEERGKVYSSRINSQRPGKRIATQKSVSESQHSEIWVMSLSGTQLQEELYRSMERESAVEQQLEKLCTQFLSQTSDKMTQSKGQATTLTQHLDELNVFVTQLHEQIWVEQHKNKVLRDMVVELTNQQATLKKQMNEYLAYMKSQLGQLESVDLKQLDIKMEDMHIPAQQLIEQMKSNADVASRLKTQIKQLEQQMAQLRSEKAQLVVQQGSIVSAHNLQLQQLATEHSQQQQKLVTEHDQVVSQLKQQIQQIGLTHQAALIEEQGLRLDERTRLVQEHQKERQEIYKSWEQDQAAMRDKFSALDAEKKRLEQEWMGKLESLQTQFDLRERIPTNFDSENSLSSFQRTPLSVKSRNKQQQQPDLETAIKHYKAKAKEQLKQRVAELEAVLCYLNDLLLGWNFETQQPRANSLQSLDLFHDQGKLLQAMRRLEQRNPALIGYVNQMKGQIELLYEQNLQFKVRFLSFVNESIVQIISHEPVICESLIRENPHVQMSLNWLLEAAKLENEQEYLRDDRLIFQHAELLWGELVARCLSGRQLVCQDSQMHNTSMQSDVTIKSAKENAAGIIGDCSVPELSEIMNIQMGVVCNLLSALTTICGTRGQQMQSPTSQTPLLGVEWLASIRPSLDQSTQLAKALAPGCFRVDDQQQQLDTFVHKALSGLSTLNKRLNELPHNFFASLTLQHSSLTHCILKFANAIGSIKEVHDCNTLLADFNDTLRSQCIDSMQMFTVYLVQVCSYFTSPRFVKDLTTTFIIHLHRREIKSTETIKKRTNSECKSSSRVSQQPSFRQQGQDSYYVLEELATFLCQLSEHLAL